MGKAVSNGCIRLHNANVIEVFNLVPIGTPVKII
ncbi:L,D-transpeptidase [Clostridium homopropionicum]